MGNVRRLFQQQTEWRAWCLASEWSPGLNMKLILIWYRWTYVCHLRGKNTCSIRSVICSTLTREQNLAGARDGVYYLHENDQGPTLLPEPSLRGKKKKRDGSCRCAHWGLRQGQLTRSLGQGSISQADSNYLEPEAKGTVMSAGSSHAPR